VLDLWSWSPNCENFTTKRREREREKLIVICDQQFVLTKKIFFQPKKRKKNLDSFGFEG
jgi:predicted house-cleaning NTP pyrophosphatase (Maf/HAM1 superfamily)